MKRGYTALEYKSIIRRLRAARPDICITSDFIVGFPGETEHDFEATMKLIDDVGFDASFSFMYSPRPGTPAAEMPDDMPQEVKAQRLKRLQDRIAQQEASHRRGDGRHHAARAGGRRVEEGRAGTGRAHRQQPVVNFPGSPGMIGRFVEVKITAGDRAYAARRMVVH